VPAYTDRTRSAQQAARHAILKHTGMIGLDEGGWDPAASREAPSSQNQRKKQVPKARTTRPFLSLHKRAG